MKVGTCPICRSSLRMRDTFKGTRNYHTCPTPEKHPPLEDGTKVFKFSVSRKQSYIDNEWAIPNLHFLINGDEYIAEVIE